MGRSLARHDVMSQARRAHPKSRTDAALSFTQRVVAELAPYTPLLPCCRRSLVEGLALVTSDPGSIATTRPVAVRAAMQTLHADGIPAHVSRIVAARRTQVLGCRRRSVDPAAARRSAPAAGGAASAAHFSARDVWCVLTVSRISRSVARSEMGAAQLVDDFDVLGVPARSRRRRGRWVVTVRSGPVSARR